MSKASGLPGRRIAPTSLGDLRLSCPVPALAAIADTTANAKTRRPATLEFIPCLPTQPLPDVRTKTSRKRSIDRSRERCWPTSDGGMVATLNCHICRRTHTPLAKEVLMTSYLVRRLIVVGAFLTILALPVAGSAQEAVLSGTVTDSTGAVLPGVTVRALLEASGNTFDTVTDARGAYQISVRVGVYKITAELQGFKAVTRDGIALLAGRTAAINLQMAPGDVKETVTVTGEAPLIDTLRSSVGGNIDPKQVQELPSAGRNWIALALLSPGNRTNG